MSTPTMVEEILIGALSQASDAAREAYLHGACRGDDALRAEVERLLQAHQHGAERIEPPVRPDPEQTTSYAAESASREAPGVVIAGRYKLLQPIGEGGMGSVWLAEQAQPVRRKVALKLVKAGMDSRQVLARFDAERQALAVMDHPNIARVLDGGATEEGRPYFVMEYVKGVAITDYCDQARLTVPDRLRLLVPVCEAVQHAHHKGIVHRDLKPSNVLVCLYDGKPVPKVIDFGLAKATSQPLTEHTMFTAHGVVLGTPLYMSPEQAELNNLDVDTRTDVYSLGVILYELLTGSTPLEKRRVQEAAWHEMLRLIQEEEPPRPSLRLSSAAALPSLAAQRGTEPVRLSRMLRGELDWVVLKALEKDRARRYGTPAELAGDIGRYLDGDLVQARPPSAGYRVRKFVRRHRAGVVAAAAFAALLVGATILSAWQAVVARRAEARAVAARNDAMRARRAESAARGRAETHAHALTYLDRRRPLDEKADDPAAFLGLVDLLRHPVPEGAGAWREHLVMKVLMAGERFGLPTRLADHEGQAIVGAHLSRDRRRIVTEADDGALELRAFPGLKRLARLEGTLNGSYYGLHGGGLLDDDRVVATVSDDGREVLLWDSATGRRLGASRPHPGPVSWLLPLGRSSRFLTWVGATQEDAPAPAAPASHRLFLWDVDVEKPIASLELALSGSPELEYKSWRFATAPDGSWFAIANKNTLAIRSGRDGSLVRLFSNYENAEAMAVDDSSRYLAVLMPGEMRFLDARDWSRPRETTRWEDGAWIESFEWVAGSDRLLRPSASTDWEEFEVPDWGVMRGREAPLPFNPYAVDGPYILSSDGQVYRLETCERVDPAAGRTYPEEARRFAAEGRWLVLPGQLIDLVVEQPLALPQQNENRYDPGQIFLVDTKGLSWCRLAWPYDDRGKWNAVVYEVWPLPARPSDLRSDLLIAWAEVLVGGRSDRSRGFHPFTEAEWESRRQALAARLAEPGSPMLPGFDPVDRLYWLRRRIASTPENARLPLLDRLVAEEPLAINFAQRAVQLGDPLRMMSSQLEAARIGGPKTWKLIGAWGMLYPGESLRSLSEEWRANESRLVLEYLDTIARDAPDPSGLEIDDAPAVRGLALYRVGRFEEALQALAKITLDAEKPRSAIEVVVRAMARFKRGEQAEARAEYAAACAGMSDSIRNIYPALLAEAAKLFGP